MEWASGHFMIKKLIL
ncbi:MAG: hypothetical protein DRI86_00090 [Bacteroidetes bacterium]|nr:MAG: hypothetical protein DRI86_00090 [Bacteroidota bacterium]